MNVEAPSEATLLKKIEEKRSEIAAYLARAVPRNRRLINVSIICGAIAAAFTAGPALGGERLTEWLTTEMGLETPIWRILCFGAALCSLASVIATNLAKSHQTAASLSIAQTADAKLEGLHTLLQLQQISIKDATTQYVGILGDISFL